MTEPAPTPSPQLTPTPEPTPTPTPAVATKPEFLPDTYWDAKAGAINTDAFGQHYGELTGKAQKFDEAEAARAALPQKVEDYKLGEVKLPDGVTVPEGMKIGDHPLKQQAVEWALKNGVSPAVLSELNTHLIVAQIKAHTAQQEAFAAETKKLGADAVARRNAVITWANGLKDKGDLTAEEAEEIRLTTLTAAGTIAFEKLMKKIAGTVPGTEPPREPTPQPKTHAERIWPSGFAAHPQQRA